MLTGRAAGSTDAAPDAAVEVDEAVAEVLAAGGGKVTGGAEELMLEAAEGACSGTEDND